MAAQVWAHAECRHRRRHRPPFGRVPCLCCNAHAAQEGQAHSVCEALDQKEAGSGIVWQPRIHNIAGAGAGALCQQATRRQEGQQRRRCGVGGAGALCQRGIRRQGGRQRRRCARTPSSSSSRPAARPRCCRRRRRRRRRASRRRRSRRSRSALTRRARRPPAPRDAPLSVGDNEGMRSEASTLYCVPLSVGYYNEGM